MNNYKKLQINMAKLHINMASDNMTSHKLISVSIATCSPGKNFYRDFQYNLKIKNNSKLNYNKLNIFHQNNKK